MPELPEVENIAIGLRQEILGCRIESIKVIQPLVLRGPFKSKAQKAVQTLTNSKITEITRRGKRLIIITDSPLDIIIQLGMTGRFVIHEPSDEPAKHTHMLVNLDNGKQLRFVDVRRFGRVCFIEALDIANPDPAMEAVGMSKMGPEPLAISKANFLTTLQGLRAVKTLLLDQQKIAGLGNIYVDESLFAAGIHPITVSETISPQTAEKLRKAIGRILKKSIEQGGTSFSDYRNAYGQMGRFLKMLKVYQRQGQPCKKCKTPIEKFVLGGRSTHFCPQCQPVPVGKKAWTAKTR